MNEAPCIAARKDNILINEQAEALAARLERGATALAAFAATLSDGDWNSRLPRDGRKVGVVVHHVASVYPLEIDLASKVGTGNSISGVTMNDVHAMNARHAADFDTVTRDAAVDLLRRNSAAAAAAIRTLSGEQLAHAETVSLYADAPVTCQFVLEDHAVRHSYHHLDAIRRALQR